MLRGQRDHNIRACAVWAGSELEDLQLTTPNHQSRKSRSQSSAARSIKNHYFYFTMALELSKESTEGLKSNAQVDIPMPKNDATSPAGPSTHPVTDASKTTADASKIIKDPKTKTPNTEIITRLRTELKSEKEKVSTLAARVEAMGAYFEEITTPGSPFVCLKRQRDPSPVCVMVAESSE